MNELRKRWALNANAKLVGRTIKQVRYMTDEEIKDMGWGESCLVIILDDGSWFFPSSDDEGNNPGALFTSYDDLPIIPVCR